MTSCDLPSQGGLPKTVFPQGVTRTNRFRFRSQEQLYPLTQGWRGASAGSAAHDSPTGGLLSRLLLRVEGAELPGAQWSGSRRFSREPQAPAHSWRSGSARGPLATFSCWVLMSSASLCERGGESSQQFCAGNANLVCQVHSFLQASKTRLSTREEVRSYFTTLLWFLRRSAVSDSFATPWTAAY